MLRCDRCCATCPTTDCSSSARADVVARLLLHVYVLAMVNSHVVLGYPLLEFPRLDDMERLVGTS